MISHFTLHFNMASKNLEAILKCSVKCKKVSFHTLKKGKSFEILKNSFSKCFHIVHCISMWVPCGNHIEMQLKCKKCVFSQP